jgi:hypothetical protein
LVNADGEAAAGGGYDVTLCADEKRLRGVLVADARDERAATCVVERKDAEEIFEAARDAIGRVVGFGVGVAQGAGGGEEEAFAGGDVDGGVDPELVAGELNFLGETGPGGG